MKRLSFLRYVLGFLAAAVGLGLALGWASRLARPKTAAEVRQYSPQEIAAAEAWRDVEIDPAHPIVLHRDVDYSTSPTAPWRPRGESPILADLVKQGRLPPVSQRASEEPCVMEGVEGVGRYGGTWIRIANAASDVNIINNRLSYSTLLRFSPLGYPLVPHVAKSYTASPDYRVFTFQLRKGMKWSDGQPFTADDILYWYEHECMDTAVLARPDPIMMVGGKAGRIEKLGPWSVRFTFPEPNGLFLVKVATASGSSMLNCPAHYLRPFHPTIGDKALIESRMRARKLLSPLAAYRDVKDYLNPEHPRLWPWLYHTFKPNPPQSFIRNPYYWAVDTQGNQLPYVDRLLFEVKTPDMLEISAANGEVTMQARHIRYDKYTLLMSQREKYGYDVYHWYPGDRGAFVIYPNLNLRVDPGHPDTARKSQLMNDVRFRRALSLAINRQAIIQAEYNGQTEPAQVAPGRSSFFYDPALYSSCVAHDPDQANRLLDEIGLVRRDLEGFRTFLDGSRMTFFFSYCNFTGAGPAQFVVDDWANVGIRAILRERSRALYDIERAALVHDFGVWMANGEFMPLIQPRHFAPVVSSGSDYAVAFARWYERGGFYGDPRADRAHGCVEPPPDHPLRKALEIYQRAAAEGDPARQRDIFQEALEIAAENLWSINICTPPPVLAVVKNGFHNVPRKAVYSWDFQSPGNCGIETYFFESPHDSPGAIAQMRQEVVEITPPGDVLNLSSQPAAAPDKLAPLVRGVLLSIGVLLVVLVAVRHPYVGRRLLIMIPTLLVISVVVFVVIQLPPGDYVTTRIMQLRESGDQADLQQVQDLKQMFSLEEPMPLRYARWLGLPWFASFDEKDNGLLQGAMGRSMETLRPVNQIVGDRILLTVLISLSSILFTWALAIPIGIYSAVRQYSLGDYLLTFLGFIGMCIPNFLLALLLMFVSAEWIGIPVSGLFSSQFGAQPEWTWAKVADLLKHIWVPIFVLGVGGTASMIRVMRGNLLDELRKPYVVAARARGVRPLKLLFKYPVRIALNPFVSGIGSLFPQLVSGGAIVAMVLSLPTVGPLMLSALMSEDMYLAGSMLMVLSLLGVLGTLVSDLLLLWLDPRIRYKGGSR